MTLPAPCLHWGSFLRQRSDPLIGSPEVPDLRNVGGLAAIIEDAAVGIVVVDRTGLIHLVNVMAERIFGRPRATLIGQPIETCFAPDSRKAFLKTFRSYVRKPTHQALGAGGELVAVRGDGSELAVEVGLSLVPTVDEPVIKMIVTDASARSELLRELERSEQRLRGVIETAPSGIVVVNATGIITLMNAAAATMFGYDRSDLVGTPIEQLVAAGVREVHQREREAYLQDPQTRHMGLGRDLRGVRRNGDEFPVEVGLSVVETPDGPLVTAIVTDISERLNAAEETRRALEHQRHLREIDQEILAGGSSSDLAERALGRLRQLVPHAARAGVSLLDEDGTTLRLFAVATDEPTAVGVGTSIPIDEVVGGDRLLSGVAAWTPDLAATDPTNPSAAILIAEGMRSSIGIPLTVEGRVFGALGLTSRSIGAFSGDDVAFASDVAAQLAIGIKQAELRERLARNADDLARSAQRLDYLHEIDREVLSAHGGFRFLEGGLRRLNDLVPSIDRSGIVRLFRETDEFEIVAQAADGSSAFPPGTMVPLAALPWLADVGNSEVEILDEVGIGRFPEIAAGLQLGTKWLVVVPMRADGDVIGFLTVTSREVAGVPPDGIAFMVEVASQFAMGLRQAILMTELQHYAEELEDRVEERTKRLSDINAQLDAFAYSVSHDLRAPLRAMQGFSQALLEDHGEQLGVEGRDYAQRVVAGASRMDDMIADLLAYSRLGREELPLSPLDLAETIAESVEQVRESAPPGAVIDVEGPFPPAIGHGPTAVQVFVNLLANGMKFVDKGTDPRVVVRALERDDRVRIEFRDNGIGIAPEFHERIFGVMERLHGTSAYPGTGIGLAIVAKGVERMDGSAGVASALGEGSIFWVELPAAAGPPAGIGSEG